MSYQLDFYQNSLPSNLILPPFGAYVTGVIRRWASCYLRLCRKYAGGIWEPALWTILPLALINSKLVRDNNEGSRKGYKLL